MNKLPNMAALFGTTEKLDGSSELSPIESFLHEFEMHEVEEETSISQYRKVLGSLSDPVTRFILQLIVSDEEKHRAIMQAMIATLRGGLMWTQQKDSLEGIGEPATKTDDLRVSTDNLIKLEKDGIRECKTLVKKSTKYYDGLFKLLLGSIIKDSEKHLELLEFLRERLKVA